MNALALPTRRDEAFRYADLAALAPLWPVAVEAFAVGAGEHRALSIVSTGDAAIVRELAITLAAGASFDLRILSAGSSYARIVVRAELGEGANLMLGAAQLCAGAHTLEVVTEVLHTGRDATSRQVVRSVAGGGATVNYLGKVKVARGADGTDGSQSVRAMLLDRQSAANANNTLNQLPRFLVGAVDDVARQGLQAMQRGDVICVPGVLNRLGTLASRSTPKWLVRRMGGLLGKQLL